MRKLLLAGVLAAAMTSVACGGSSTNEEAVAPAAAPGEAKQTRIHFTHNYRKGTNPGQYNTDCIGIVTTEQIKGDKGQKIMWKVNRINGESRDDECTGLTNLSTVNLRFVNDVMGPGAMKRLDANSGGVIEGTVSSNEMHYNGTRYQKYQVYIGNNPAGPDPIIVVDCGSCGPE
jgi:hypothetical protein